MLLSHVYHPLCAVLKRYPFVFSFKSHNFQRTIRRTKQYLMHGTLRISVYIRRYFEAYIYQKFNLYSLKKKRKKNGNLYKFNFVSLGVFLFCWGWVSDLKWKIGERKKRNSFAQGPLCAAFMFSFLDVFHWPRLYVQ